MSRTSIANGVEQLAMTQVFLGHCCTLLPRQWSECVPFALIFALVPLFVVFSSAWFDRLLNTEEGLV